MGLEGLEVFMASSLSGSNALNFKEDEVLDRVTFGLKKLSEHCPKACGFRQTGAQPTNPFLTSVTRLGSCRERC